MKHKEKYDLPHNINWLSVTQVPDFSFSDGANIEAVKPKNVKRPRIKTVIENAKPEL